MDQTKITVGIADLKVCKGPAAIETQSLGSCVGIVLYDPVTKIGGLAHVMLPNSHQALLSSKPGKYADTAIQDMLGKMVEAGAVKTRIVAKIVGGACMFSGAGVSEFMNIGLRNITATKEILAAQGIPIIAEDCGGFYGRSIEFNTETGALVVRSALYGTKQV